MAKYDHPHRETKCLIKITFHEAEAVKYPMLTSAGACTGLQLSIGRGVAKWDVTQVTSIEIMCGHSACQISGL